MRQLNSACLFLPVGALAAFLSLLVLQKQNCAKVCCKYSLFSLRYLLVKVLHAQKLVLIARVNVRRSLVSGINVNADINLAQSFCIQL